jgi:hypothetical protein
MFWLRLKLQYYRLRRLEVVRLIIRQIKRNFGLFLTLVGYIFYFGFLRRKYFMTKEGQILHKLQKSADSWFRNMLKWQMHTNLFSNKIMDDITARSLLWLVHQEHVKKLMTDLFLMIYKNRDVEVII